MELPNSFIFNSDSSMQYNTYRRFFLALLASFGLAVGILWYYSLNDRLSYANASFPIWEAKMQMVRHCDAGGGFAVTGDSRAMAGFVPSLIDHRVVNLAFNGETPIEMYWSLKRILSCGTKPRAIIISLSPYQFVLAKWFWIAPVPFGFYSYSELNVLLTDSRALQDPILFGPHTLGDIDARLKAGLCATGFPGCQFPEILYGQLKGRRIINEQKLRDTMMSRGQVYVGMAESAYGLDTDATLDRFQPSRLMDYYFNQALALLEAQGVQAYFASTPVDTAAASRYADSLGDDFKAYLVGYEHRYRHFAILGTALPCFPPTYFGDGAHLNPRGARAWSEVVRRELNAVGTGEELLLPEAQAQAPQSYELAVNFPKQAPRNCTALLQVQ
jgi:hypothetical protein